MRFRGGGSVGVPVFDVSATIPGLAVITSPVATSGGAATVINTSEDLSVTWLPIAIGQIHFVLHAGDDLRGPSEATVACTFEGASGAGAVPHALLSSVREMFPAGPSYVVLSSESDASTTIDGLAITTWSFQSSPTEDLVFNVALQ